MSEVTVEGQGTVAVVRLSHGVTNAIGRGLVRDLASALEEAKSRFRALVLAGNPKFFSIGLDLPELLRLGRGELATFWDAFNQVCFDLYTLPMPSASAIAGHAVAGGTILALTTDYRVVASGRKLLGLNEIKLGLPVPYLPALILGSIVGDRASTDLLYRGELLEPEPARTIGLVDAVCTPDEVEPQAVARMAELAAMPREAMAGNKATRVEVVSARYRANIAERSRALLDLWFAPETQKALAEAAAKF